jgi:Ran GTPase-activating protein (RanGAP) involved in mRNA processing and transport
MTNLSIYRNRNLEQKIQNCKPCSRIDLRKEKLTDSDIEIIIQEAIINKQCTMLWLFDNQITSQGVSMLASILYNNTTLEGLSLCNNGITDDDVLYLTRPLSDNKSKLNRLALTSNNITDEGAKYLVEMLKTNQTLTQLWLGFNKITDHGVQLFMNVLANHNKTLHVLSLAWNQLVTDSSVDFVIDMLEHNQTLRTVCLSNCNLSDTNKVKLREATKLHKEFYLDL